MPELVSVELVKKLIKDSEGDLDYVLWQLDRLDTEDEDE